MKIFHENTLELTILANLGVLTSTNEAATAFV